MSQNIYFCLNLVFSEQYCTAFSSCVILESSSFLFHSSSFLLHSFLSPTLLFHTRILLVWQYTLYIWLLNLKLSLILNNMTQAVSPNCTVPTRCIDVCTISANFVHRVAVRSCKLSGCLKLFIHMKAGTITWKHFCS